MPRRYSRINDFGGYPPGAKADEPFDERVHRVIGQLDPAVLNEMRLINGLCVITASVPLVKPRLIVPGDRTR
jgi:hypothetical protein